VILNKIDLFVADKRIKRRLGEEKIPHSEICASSKGWEVTSKIKSKIIETLPDEWLNSLPIIADLIEPGDVARICV
jgi:50S ribosomal subunit-associated GTPase HflX